MDIRYQIGLTIVLLIILLIIGLSTLGLTENSEEEFEETEKEIVLDRVDEQRKDKCKIPRRIVQTYFTRELPVRMWEATQSFKDLNPDFDYVFYDNDRARDYLDKHFSKESGVLEAFDLLIPGAYKADLFRICELYGNGGYYCDVTMVCLENLEYLEQFDVDCILTKDFTTNFYCDSTIYDPYAIYNAFLACKPKCKLIKMFIEATVKNILNRNMGEGPLDITGPIFLGNILNKYLQTEEISPGLKKCKDGETLYILLHTKSSEFNSVAHINDNGEKISLIKTKYDGFMKDRPKGSHYSELYHSGRVFNEKKNKSK